MKTIGRRIALITWCVAVCLVTVLLLPLGIASAQSQSGSCRYIYLDGTTSGELFVSLEDCAKTILDETIGLGLDEGLGIFDKYALRVDLNGDVYASSIEFISTASDLDWQYLGNLLGNTPSSQQPTTRSQPVDEAPATTTTNTSRSEQRGVVPTSLQQIFDIAAEDINDFWNETFKEYGFQYTEPRITLFDRSQVSTGCGVAPAQVGPFYCNIDHTMYYPAWFMEQQWRTHGDYAVVTIIAHEWGHAVQNLLGGLDSGDYTITIELEADCFAGAYTAYANERSTKIRLDASDIEEGANALFNAGDPDGTPWWDSQAHGNGDQRYEAFMEGFKFGVTACGTD